MTMFKSIKKKKPTTTKQSLSWQTIQLNTQEIMKFQQKENNE